MRTLPTVGLLLMLLLLTACSADTDVVAGESETATPTRTVPATATASRRPAPPTATADPGEPPTEARPTATTAPVTPVSDVETHFESPEYGIQAFLFWHPKIARRDLRLIDEMGFGWVKQSFAWRDIEPFEGAPPDWWKPDKVVQQVEATGLKLLVRLDRQPFWSQENTDIPLENAPPADFSHFGTYCGRVAERYRGRIQAYQVWNEPNLSREWGGGAPDPVAYTELLRVCYEAIKAADPDAIVVSAGLAPTGTELPVAIPDAEFLQGMYDAGAAAYFDVLGVNAPGYAEPPETSPAEAEEKYGHRFFAFRHVEDIRALMEANGDGAKQIAILEMGWTLDEVNPEYAWFAVDAATQADYLVRAYQFAAANWQPWIGLMTTIYVADVDWTPEDEQWWWSIVLPDGSTRPAYTALKEMEKQ